MVFAGFVVVLIVVCISLFGWGSLANRLTRNPVRNKAVIVCVGLAVVVFLGGVLNLLRLAYGWALDGLILGGIVLAIVLNRGYRPSLPKKGSEWRYVIVLGLVIVGIMVFTVATQLPPKAFNIHDDFDKYFAYPVRMLATGTVFSSPLSAIGVQTLGGQAVLHALVINHFPVAYMNGVDAVFGLLLCIMVPISIVPRRLFFVPISLAGALLVVFINPQYVNISSLYIASAFMMATILLLSWNDGESTGERNYFPSPILLGLMYAALFALKSHLPVFAAIQGVLFCIAMLMSGVSVRRLGLWAVSTVLYTLLFVSPWIMLHLPHYIHPSSLPPINDIPAPITEELSLFSFRALSYGASFGHYTFLAVASGLPVISLYLGKLKARAVPEGINVPGVIASSAATIIAYLFFIGLGPRLISYHANLRYTIPFLIAGAPTIMTFVSLRLLNDSKTGYRNPVVVGLLFYTVLTIIGFSPSMMSRMSQAYQKGNILAYFTDLPAPEQYLAYNNEVLQGSGKERMAVAQQMVPAGQPIIAWVTTPFYLDYKRNVIFDVDLAGLGASWAHIPEGVSYFMVEYSGYGVFPLRKYYETTQEPGRKGPAQIALHFLRKVQELGMKGDVLYDDGNVVVFKTI